MCILICFLHTPVGVPEHSGQYWCVARRGGKTSECGVSLNVVLQTSHVPPPTVKRVSGGRG